MPWFEPPQPGELSIRDLYRAGLVLRGIEFTETENGIYPVIDVEYRILKEIALPPGHEE